MFKPQFQRLGNFTSHKYKPRRKGIYKIVALPDIHVPEHDEKALNAVLEFCDWYRPHGYIVMGDFLEMRSVSHWGDNEGLTKDEADAGREVLGLIESCMPRADKWYLVGNHEDWLDQFVQKESPALKGLFSLSDILGLRSYNVIPLNEILEIGDARFIHGYYTNNYHAKKHLDVFGCNIYYGHLHDCQAYQAVTVKGLKEAMSLGCLRTLKADFLRNRPTNWVHAFGIFEFNPDSTYTRYVPIIINGRFSFNGKVFG